MPLDLTPERALIFRITHIRNVPWILRNGLHCRSSETLDPDFIPIGNRDLIAKRRHRPVAIPPGGTLADYVPFYFTPCSPMLFNILTGYQDVERRSSSEIVVLVASLRGIRDAGVSALFTDQHAYPLTARYYSDLEALDAIDWDLLRSRDFRTDPEDPNKKERYQAEALVHRHLPAVHLLGIGCAKENEERTLREHAMAAGSEVRIVVRPDWFFGR